MNTVTPSAISILKTQVFRELDTVQRQDARHYKNIPTFLRIARKYEPGMISGSSYMYCFYGTITGDSDIASRLAHAVGYELGTGPLNTTYIEQLVSRLFLAGRLPSNTMTWIATEELTCETFLNWIEDHYLQHGGDPEEIYRPSQKNTITAERPPFPGTPYGNFSIASFAEAFGLHTPFHRREMGFPTQPLSSPPAITRQEYAAEIRQEEMKERELVPC